MKKTMLSRLNHSLSNRIFYRSNPKGSLIIVLASVAFLATQASGTVMLRDFQGTGFDFEYGSFSGNVSTNPTYVSVVNATESGGAGVNLTPLNLSSYVSSGYLSIEVRLGSGNLANNFNVNLFTDSSNYVGFQFSTSSLNTSTFTTLTLNLNTPTFTVGTIDWTNITQFQIQGDYSSTDNFSLDFRNLEVIPEPNSLILLSLGLAWLVLLRARRKPVV